jgi:Predicted RNA-binding protein containing KH domain, possibly ribosomal protein
MLTVKERAGLRSAAQAIDSIFQIGKNGITENLITDLSAALEARELIKITVLKTADFSAKELIAELADSLGAEPVQAIGNKIVLYRKSEKKS